MNLPSASRALSWALLGGLLVLGSGCGEAPAVRWDERGVARTPLIDEASGLAPSRHEDDLYWVHNDSGSERVLMAIDGKARLVGVLRPTGLAKQPDMDWEDLASFVLDGRPLLLVADVGDNQAVRPRVRFHVVEEPTRAQMMGKKEYASPVLWTQELVYPGGPRDCESVAVDPVERKVYLLTKREFPAVLYVAPLDAQNGPVTLVAVGKVDSLPQPDSWQLTLPAPRGKYVGQPTAMDFSTDGRWAVVLTYGNVAFFHRRAADTWGAALSRPAVWLGSHGIAQAESVCFERAGLAIRAMGEGVDPILFRGRWKVPPEEAK